MSRTTTLHIYVIIINTLKLRISLDYQYRSLHRKHRTYKHLEITTYTLQNGVKIILQRTH